MPADSPETSLVPDKSVLLREIGAARQKWGARPADVHLEPVGSGEESVWDYPRPPIIAPSSVLVCVVFSGKTVAQSLRALRVLETAGAPVYYLPREDVHMSWLELQAGYSICEWKGAAVYYDIVVRGERARRAAFSYPDPLDDLAEGYGMLAGRVGFYPGRVDACYVGSEKVRPQPGTVYAGWVTANIKGPIKGGPGTAHW